MQAKNKFTVVSTFSGCGGSSLGYQMAGGKVLLAVEWDDHAVENYKLNFPETDVYHGDIAALPVEEVLARTGLKPGELDIFDGSPPCQGFSVVGKRDLKDPRNQLFKEYCRLLEGLQPKCFVMENVSGMVKGKMRFLFVEILKELKSCGYEVKAAVLNAKYFGVAQARERMIFIGVRNDLKVNPSFPLGDQNIITAKTAFVGLVDNTEHQKLSEGYKDLWEKIPPGKRGDFVTAGKNFSTKKLHPNKPSPTLTKTGLSTGFATTFHWAEPRAVSIPEAKRLHSFPDDFILQGSYEQQWARIGNSVPPLLMKAIANHINEKILSNL